MPFSGPFGRASIERPWDRLSAFAPDSDGGFYAVPPYAAWWLTARPDEGL